MTEKILVHILRDGGLDEEDFSILMENEMIARAVALAAKRICNVYRTNPSTKVLRPNRSGKERVTLDRALTAMSAVQSRGTKLTVITLARELGCGRSSVYGHFDRHPVTKVAFEDAVMNPPKLL